MATGTAHVRLLVLFGLPVASGLVAAAGCKRSPEPNQTSQPFTVLSSKPVETDEDGDALVIDKLRASGANLALPLPVDFYLYFSNEAAANKVASAMRSDGYLVDVEPPSRDVPEWACLGHKTMLVDLSSIQLARARLTVLAKESNGEYDGWEAPVRP
jgi:hypothetical protein